MINRYLAGDCIPSQWVWACASTSTVLRQSMSVKIVGSTLRGLKERLWS